MGYAKRRFCRVSNKVDKEMIRLYVLLAYICFWAFSNAQQRIYVENIDISKDSLCLFELKDSPIAYSIEVRAALNKNVEQDGYSSQEWGIVWNYKTAEEFSYVKIVCGNLCYGDYLDQRYADVVIGNWQNGINSVVESKRFYKGVDTSVGYNSLLFEWENGVAKFFVGNNELKFVTKTDVGTNNGLCGVYANEILHVMSIAVDTKPNIKKKLSTDWSLEKINNHLMNSDDINEGYWEYLDRDNNDKKAKIGGRYKFALIKDGEDYIIFYIAGAVTNKSSWVPGMIKGRLRSTVFENHYDLVWYDSMFEPIETDAHADIIDDIILNLQFPIYESSFRLYKIRKASY